VPLHVRVIDALGATRHELFRATRQGLFSISLPLAANDPAGEWKVLVTELLGNHGAVVPFHYTPPVKAAAIMGTTPRAVSAANDRDNAFRFARTHHDVTIVKGTSPYNDAAAKRLSKVLVPWGVRCKEMPLAEASKSRRLTEEEAATWCGLVYAGKGQIKAGDANPPVLAGFAVQGPVILLGNPEDNAMIKFLLAEKFLPYAPNPESFPGRGRGMLAWQRDAIGPGQESLALIAYDEAGIEEAVGSLYEAIAGIEPLTRWTLPQSSSLSAAKSVPGQVPAPAVVWTAYLPDRVEGLGTDSKSVTALTHDGSRSVLTADGKLTGSQPLDRAALEQARKELLPGGPALHEVVKQQQRPDRMLKLTASGDGKVAVAYWGGTLRIVDGSGAVKAQTQLPQDVTALTWAGNRVVAGLADGRVMALEVK
jgi:hypothetical protein